MNSYLIDSTPLTFNLIQKLLAPGSGLELSAEACNRIQACRDYLDKKIAGKQNPYMA
jgi:histidine ammonia-lyase